MTYANGWNPVRQPIHEMYRRKKAPERTEAFLIPKFQAFKDKKLEPFDQAGPDLPVKTGWIKLHRKIIDSRVFSNADLYKLWSLCLLMANHEEMWVEIDGVVEPVKVKPGQFITGRYSLHNKYYGKKKKNIKSPLTIWRWMLKLQKWQNLNIETNNKYSIITICNWDTYQHTESKNEQQNEHGMNNRRTSDEHQMNTNNNDNNVNKNKSVTPSVSHEAVELGNFLLENIIKAIPTHRYSKNKPKLDRWYQDIDKAMRIDGRTPKQLRYLISYIFTQDTDRANFWKPNIQSGKKLREKFDTIAQQIKNDRKRGGYQPDTGVVFDPDDVKWMTKEEAQRDSLEYFRDPLEKTMSCYNMQTHNGKTYYKRTSE